MSNEHIKTYASTDYVDNGISILNDKIPNKEKYTLIKTLNIDLDTSNPDYLFDNAKGIEQRIINFDFKNDLSDLAISATLTLKNTDFIIIKDISEYHFTSNKMLITLFGRNDIIYDNKIIGLLSSYVNANLIYDYDSNTTSKNFGINLGYINFARSDEHILNDPNNIFTNGFELVLNLYSINNNYAGDYYNLPYNIQNGSGSSIYQKTCYVDENAYNTSAIGYKCNINSTNAFTVGYMNDLNGSGCIFGASSSTNANATYSFGTGNNLYRNYSLAFGIGLNIPNESTTKGNVIIGTGGTLAKDSLFAISTGKVNTSSSDISDIRYPFEVKDNNDVYLRGNNIILETDNEPLLDNHLTNKKYVDDSMSSLTIPTKTSELTNDSNFITSIPSEYITETTLESRVLNNLQLSQSRPEGARAWIRPTFPNYSNEFVYIDDWTHNTKFVKDNEKVAWVATANEGTSCNENKMYLANVTKLVLTNNTNTDILYTLHCLTLNGSLSYTAGTVPANGSKTIYCTTSGVYDYENGKLYVQNLINPGDLSVEALYS